MIAFLLISVKFGSFEPLGEIIFYDCGITLASPVSALALMTIVNTFASYYINPTPNQEEKEAINRLNK